MHNTINTVVGCFKIGEGNHVNVPSIQLTSTTDGAIRREDSTS